MSIRQICNAFKNQKGAFAPFMFGLLIGITIFSTVITQWIRKEIKITEERRIKVEKQKTENVASALETSILAENQNVPGFEFSNDVSINRARPFTSKGTLETRGGEDYQLKSSSAGDFAGLQNKRVVISSSDDTFVKEKVDSYISSNAMSYLGGQTETPVTLMDTQEIRTKQIKQTRENMNMLASQIYLMWSRGNEFKFPTTSEFETVSKNLGLRTVWGEYFKYIRTDDNTARLEFSTPWGYKEGMDLKMEE